jgi:hypothetical protein
MRVGREFSLSTEEALCLLEMVKNYDKQRGELLERSARESEHGRPTF